ncbi:hypothetical protein BJ546DRAFT_1023079 [Cryomyces antarcticus]
MDAFVSRKRRRLSPPEDRELDLASTTEDDCTDVKLCILASLHPTLDQETLLEALLASDGSVGFATRVLKEGKTASSPRKRVAGTSYQSSISMFSKKEVSSPDAPASKAARVLTKKGKTLHLYSPPDVEAHTPYSIIHNFLPLEEANSLLNELLTVESPHTMCFYVNSLDEAQQQKTEYVYNGSYIADVRTTLPEMLRVSAKVQEAVNLEIGRRIETHYPGAKKLKYQSPHPWLPNAAFVNCYDGGSESVGYHSDQLTYLGPRAVIGSLSLGVAREFRVRKIVPKNENDKRDDVSADAEGQISIHLPHNSLLVMHAEMQEEWKHSIAPAQAIDPHPLAKNKRINVTYRCYKESLHPRFTPRCKCNIPAVLRCVQRKKENHGRYMWMCHANYTPGQPGCSFFQWADFDDDGEPPWAKKISRNATEIIDET